MSLICPISERSLDTVHVRLVAAQVTILGLLAVLLPWTCWIAAFLACDFALRGLTSLPSPLAWCAAILRRAFRSPPQITNAGPKIFAARLGLLLCLAALALFLLEFPAASRVAMGILVVCAFLESAAGLCLGCHMYTALRRLGGAKT